MARNGNQEPRFIDESITPSETDDLFVPATEVRETEQAKNLEDLELCRRMLSGDKDAGHEIYQRFHRLVAYFAKRFARSNDLRSVIVDEDDVRQEAFIYLMECARNYDGSIPFSGYLSAFMAKRIRRKIDSQMYAVRVPDPMRDVMRSMEAIDSKNVSHGYGPASAEFIAKELDMTLEFVERFRDLKMLREYMGSLERGYSPHLDESPGNEYVLDERIGVKPVVGEEVPDVDDQVEEIVLSEHLEAMLNALPERDATVIRMRFGLGGEQPATFNEIGDRIKLSGESVRRIEKKTLEKLGQLARSQGLQDFLE